MKMLDQIYFRDLKLDMDLPRGALRLLNGNVPIRVGGDDMDSLYDLKGVYKFIKSNVDVYLSVFSDLQISTKTYDKVFLDIDDPSIDVAREKTMAIIDKLKLRGYKEMIVLSSGSKGFHVYLPMENGVLNDYRLAVLGWLKGMGIEGYDPSVIEPMRVSRIPYSVNSKSGKKCMPFDIDKNEAVEFASCGINQGMYKDIVKMDGNVKTHDNTEDRWNDSKFGEVEDLFPQCIKDMIHADHLAHDGRVIMATFLLYAHYGDVDKVVKYFERWENFDERKAWKYVNYLWATNRKIHSCKKIALMGFCPVADHQEDCEFAPNLNRFCDKERA